MKKDKPLVRFVSDSMTLLGLTLCIYLVLGTWCFIVYKSGGYVPYEQFWLAPYRLCEFFAKLFGLMP